MVTHSTWSMSVTPWIGLSPWKTPLASFMRTFLPSMMPWWVIWKKRLDVMLRQIPPCPSPSDEHFILNPLLALLPTITSSGRIWEKALMATSDTEMKARIQGIASQIQTFQFLWISFFCWIWYWDTQTCWVRLCKALHSLAQKSMELQCWLYKLYFDLDFDLFWEKVELRRVELNVEEPPLPKRHKIPKHYELRAGEGEFNAKAKDLYEVLDHALQYHWQIWPTSF